jgi:CRP-like cAMP-binding protein
MLLQAIADQTFWLSAPESFSMLPPHRETYVQNAQLVFEKVLARYDKRVAISSEARAALLALPYDLKTYAKNIYLVREGDAARSAKLIMDGLAFRHRITAAGARQIVSLHIVGDFVDLEGSLLDVADHSVQALEDCTVAEVPRAAVVELIDQHGPLSRAMWIDTLIDASVYREWVVNVGRRDGRSAMCHLLCEFGKRLEFAGLSDGGSFEMPVTQEQLADCLGITPVHVNRVIRELDKEGVIIRRQRHIEVPNRAKLIEIAGFNEAYLHLDLLAAA